MTQTADPCVTPRHPRHQMTQACVTGDTAPGYCVTENPQVRAANDADDAGDAEIRTSDTRLLPIQTPPRPTRTVPEETVP
ncbi:hypothetical protein GCM10010247_12570 [Streptomyces calvus]|nr:hypothetical protein GCM10010247_12570 [Streptomyces calvus]